MASMFTQATGEGETIVLIHGFFEDSRVWSSVLPQLSSKYRVITVDMPGFGKSSLEGKEQSLEDMADHFHETLLGEGVESCVMIGHSMGGYLSLAFAEKYPDLLKGFGLFHSTAYADTDFKKENRLKHIDFVKRNGVEPFVKTLIPSLFSANHNYSNQIQQSLQMAKECSVEGVTNALSAMRERPERLEILQNSTVPVLFIAGKDDALIPIEKVAYQASLPAKSMFEVLENSGHMGMTEEPAKSIEMIEKFMDFVNI
jgi:pimeloyl-ACP methyl ester carboxylesterase